MKIKNLYVFVFAAMLLSPATCIGQSDITVTVTAPENHSILIEGETNVISWSVSGGENIPMKIGLISFSTQGHAWYTDPALLITGDKVYTNSFAWVPPKGGFSSPGGVYVIRLLRADGTPIEMAPFYISLESREQAHANAPRMAAN